MIKILTLFLILSSFSNCISENKLISKHFINGNVVKVRLNESQTMDLIKNLKLLIEGIDDQARLVVDKDRIKEIKKSDEIYEFVLIPSHKFSSKRFKNYLIKNIIIPITGDLSSTENKNSVIILAGDNEYDSSPYINSNGSNLLKQIIKIVK